MGYPILSDYRWRSVLFHHCVTKPNKDLSYKDVLSIWFSEFRQLEKVSEDLIVSCELTAKAQLHFHLMIRLWPIKNKYTFIKCFVNRWFHTSILLPLYGKQPTEGLPYLFKSTDETEGVTDLPSAVLNFKMLKQSKFRTALEEFYNDTTSTISDDN